MEIGILKVYTSCSYDIISCMYTIKWHLHVVLWIQRAFDFPIGYITFMIWWLHCPEGYSLMSTLTKQKSDISEDLPFEHTTSYPCPGYQYLLGRFKELRILVHTRVKKKKKKKKSSAGVAFVKKKSMITKCQIIVVYISW